MTKPHILFKHIATLGPIGYLPASGTVATALMVPVVWWLRNNFISIWYDVILCLSSFVSFYIIGQGLKFFKKKDPSAIVLDEMWAFLVVFSHLGIRRSLHIKSKYHLIVPLDLVHLILGFIFFRLLDIYKPFGIKRAEYLPAARGVMADDFIAALYAKMALASIDVIYKYVCLFM